MVSIDPADKIREMQETLGLSFLMLMDPDSETIRRYGVLNESHGKIPHPTALVIDKDGIIRYLRVDEDYKVRPDNQELLEALNRLQDS